MKKKPKKIVYPSFEQYLAQQMKIKHSEMLIEKKASDLGLLIKSGNYENGRNLAKKN